MKNARTRSIDASRRRFLIGSAAVASGGLAVGLHLPFAVPTAHAQGSFGMLSDDEVNAWVVIKPDDTVIVRIARSEMGQGTITGLAQLVTEELECDWSKVRTELPTPGQNLARKRAWGEMGTGGSRGIRTSEDYVRRGGAVARTMLLQAAANQWNVPVSELTVADGVITHTPSGRKTTYGKVSAAAAKLTPPDPKSMTLKDPRSWKVAGKPMARLDTAPKVNGSLVYAIDLKLPNMRNAAIRQCPVYTGKLASFDQAKIASMPGKPVAVRVNERTVAVVADTFWHAKKALDALPVAWDEGPDANVTSAMISAHLDEGLQAKDVFAYRVEGDAMKAIEGAAKKVEATYSTPFLAHAPMEPMNCTVRISADRAEAWAPTQNAEAALATLSETTGLPLEKCDVYRTTLGGGFGRRGASDYVRQAALIAKQFPGVAIKMIWTREEDMAQDFYRPISKCTLRAGLDDQGNITGFYLRVSGQSINAYNGSPQAKDGKDERQMQGYYATAGDAQFGYAFPTMLMEYAMRNTHVPVGPWRGVNTNQNAVYTECFMDEVAKAAGKDPLEFRRAYMSKYPKHLGVLNAVAEKAEWGKPLPAGVYRGIAQFMGYASYVAAVAEVSVSDKGDLKLHRLVLGTNCGHAVNPQQIAMQIEGSVAYGLSAALYGEITIDKGRAVEQNFNSYQIMRLAEMPKIESVIVPTYDFWGGVGEPTICVAAPAVLNAIFAATGKPVRSLPLKNESLRKA